MKTSTNAKAIPRRVTMRLANSTHRDLARQLRYLRAENEVLRRRLPKRIRLSESERRRLVRLAIAVGPAIRELVTIVSLRTLQRWVAALTKVVAAPRKPPAKPGRPRTPEELRALVVRMATDTGWGATRILGELKRLGIPAPSRSTISNILREAGLRPQPRDGPTWDEFLHMHAATLWQCDFLSKRVLTWRGFVRRYVLFFINVGTRRVVALPSSERPDAAWSAEQCDRFVEEATRSGLPRPTLVMRDRDRKYGSAFDARLRAIGVTPIALLPRSPNLNAYAERWVQSIQNECLDHFVSVGAQHLDHLVAGYIDYYHRERPHQGMGNQVLLLATESGVSLPNNAGCCSNAIPSVVRFTRLGGCLTTYRRAA